jgi:hypothetical protein
MSGMKSATIKLFLHKQLTNWINSIKDTRVRKLAEENTILCGGAITSLLSNEKLNDYDLYFRDKNTTLAIANYYVEQFNSLNGELKVKSTHSCNPIVEEITRKNIKGESEDRVVIYMKSSGVASEGQEEYQYFETLPRYATESFIDSLKNNEENLPTETFINSLNVDPVELAEELIPIVRSQKGLYRPVFFSENAISLSQKIQLVTRFYGEPNQIHNNYDFAHSMCSYDYSKNELMLHPDALEAILSKTLIYKGSLYPVASIFRLRKFINRGWRISAGQILKILFQISDINLKDPAVLREQLIGVDQAYMWQFLRQLEADKNEKLDTTYLAKLVDKIFDEEGLYAIN